jgi:hypothetical protein
MTTPDAAVQAQLAAQATGVTGQPSAGIYGDPAGAQAPAAAVDMVAAGAAPVAVDAAALLARVQQLEADAAAARPAVVPYVPPKASDLVAHLGGSLAHAFQLIENRLDAGGL